MGRAFEDATRRGSSSAGEDTPLLAPCQCEAYFTLAARVVRTKNKTPPACCAGGVKQNLGYFCKSLVEGGGPDSLSSPWFLGIGRSEWTPGIRFSPRELKRGSSAEASSGFLVV